MEEERIRAIEAACTAVTLRFFRALDRREHDAAAAVMAPDGLWERQGTPLKGRSAILAALEQRPASRATCHVVTNIAVEVLGDDHARVHFYLVAYDGTVSGTETPVARLAGIRAGTDEMVRLPEGWRIQEKRSQAVLRGG